MTGAVAKGLVWKGGDDHLAWKKSYTSFAVDWLTPRGADEIVHRGDSTQAKAPRGQVGQNEGWRGATFDAAYAWVKV